MDMQEARDIAVRFLGGLPVSDDEVFEAGNMIRESLRQNGVLDENMNMSVEVTTIAIREDELDDVW